MNVCKSILILSTRIARRTPEPSGGKTRDPRARSGDACPRRHVASLNLDLSNCGPPPSIVMSKDLRALDRVIFANTNPAGLHRQAPRWRLGATIRRLGARSAIAVVGMSALMTVTLAFVVLSVWSAKHVTNRPHPARHTGLPTTPESYLGVYATGVPRSYVGITAFAKATGVTPKLLVYYSGWFEPFQTGFAEKAAKHGAVPLVQINPTSINLSDITSGRYDDYLTSYAQEVRAYRNPVILSFGHEMNGSWYSWGYRQTSPAVFVSAWRHIVTLFRTLEIRNVTWLWTVNIIKTRNGRIPSPAPWWPGSSYVTWVGIDGYYLKSSWQFVPAFGPTIATVRELTNDPILIAETSATPASTQPTKIADLFAGIHTYGLLGFVWFNSIASHDYRLSGHAAITAYRRGAKTYNEPAS